MLLSGAGVLKSGSSLDEKEKILTPLFSSFVQYWLMENLKTNPNEFFLVRRQEDSLKQCCGAEIIYFRLRLRICP